MTFEISYTAMGRLYNNYVCCFIHIYYCTSGRAVQGNIWFEAGSIGPTIGRANTVAEAELLRSTGLTVVREGNGCIRATSNHSKEEGYSFIG